MASGESLSRMIAYVLFAAVRECRSAQQVARLAPANVTCLPLIYRFFTRAEMAFIEGMRGILISEVTQSTAEQRAQ